MTKSSSPLSLPFKSFVVSSSADTAKVLSAGHITTTAKICQLGVSLSDSYCHTYSYCQKMIDLYHQKDKTVQSLNIH